MPPLRAPVTDLTGTLTPEQIAALEQQLRAFESAEGQPDRGADRADDAAGNDRAVLHSRRRGVEARSPGRRRRRAAARREGRSRGAHRSRLRTRRRAAGRARESHHRAGHRAALSQRRFLRRHRRGRRSHHRACVEGEPLPEPRSALASRASRRARHRVAAAVDARVRRQRHSAPHARQVRRRVASPRASLACSSGF